MQIIPQSEAHLCSISYFEQQEYLNKSVLLISKMVSGRPILVTMIAFIIHRYPMYGAKARRLLA